MDHGSDVVDITAGDSDVFLTDQEMGTVSELPCVGLGGDGCRSWDHSSLDLSDGDRDCSDVQVDRVAWQELVKEAIRWRENWASRPATKRAAVTVLVDRYGALFDHRDRLVAVQKVDESDLGQLAERVVKGDLDVDFDFVFVMVGLFRDQELSKAKIITRVKCLVRAIQIRCRRACVGIVGLVPNYWAGPAAVMKGVNYNRNLSTGVQEALKLRSGVQFLPLHLHFQVRDDLDSRRLYLAQDGSLTRMAAFILRGVLLEEVGLAACPPV